VLQRSSQRRPALFDARQRAAHHWVAATVVRHTCAVVVDIDKRSSWEWPPVPLSLL